MAGREALPAGRARRAAGSAAPVAEAAVGFGVGRSGFGVLGLLFGVFLTPSGASRPCLYIGPRPPRRGANGQGRMRGGPGGSGAAEGA